MTKVSIDSEKGRSFYSLLSKFGPCRWQVVAMRPLRVQSKNLGFCWTLIRILISIISEKSSFLSWFWKSYVRFARQQRLSVWHFFAYLSFQSRNLWFTGCHSQVSLFLSEYFLCYLGKFVAEKFVHSIPHSSVFHSSQCCFCAAFDSILFNEKAAAVWI